MIHPTAIISESAQIASDVTIGPYSVIGEHVTIGSGTVIQSHVVIGKNAWIGKNNHIFQFSSIGETPIDRTFHGEFSQLIMGNNNIVREGATIHGGTAKEQGITKIGDANLFMNYIHIGHDCQLGNHITLVNNANLAGHVRVADRATIGANVGVHQFCQVGAYAFIAHLALIVQDIPAFLMVSGGPTSPSGVNTEGMKRAGFSTETIRAVREAYKLLYRKGLRLVEAIDAIEKLQQEHPELQHMLSILKNTQRGIVR